MASHIVKESRLNIKTEAFSPFGVYEIMYKTKTLRSQLSSMRQILQRLIDDEKILSVVTPKQHYSIGMLTSYIDSACELLYLPNELKEKVTNN